VIVSVLAGACSHAPAPTIPPDVDPFLPVYHNDDWTPIIREFDGVPMALVPVGCFVMGSPTSWGDNESPNHEQCIEAPYWIDVYEVTNAQYGSTGAFAGPNRPRDSVTWYDAYEHCEGRGARLPNEVEWEYTARGPDGLLYPWGNEYVEENMVRGRNAEGQTDDVGSRPGGVSWVGAHDMSGNVWEWTRSLYEPYPYDAADGREPGPESRRARTIRGGSWNIAFDVTGSYRNLYGPDVALNTGGFRCVRDYAH
jgi:iron(II)-dependent oxidoreductase